MKKLFQINLRSKLILSFAIILIIPSIAIGWTSYQSTKNHIVNQLSSSASGNVELMDHLIESFIEPRQKDVEYLAQRINALQFNGKESPLVREQLDQFQNLHPEIMNTYVGSTEGLMILSPQAELPADYDPRKRPWYQDAMANKGQAIITDPYVDAITGNIIITIAKVLNDGSGVTAIDLNIKTLGDIIQSIKIGHEGYPIILDGKGNFLVHPTVKPGSQAQEPFYKDMYQKDEGQFTYRIKDDPMTMVYTTNQLTGWKIAGTMSNEEVSKQAEPIFYVTLLVMGISIVVGAIMVTFIIRSVSSPIKELVESAEKISKGDFTEKIKVKSNDEIGRLTVSFNTMIDSLRTVLMEVKRMTGQVASSSSQMLISAEETSRATSHIASSIKQLASGAESQAHSAEESSRAMEEMASGIQRITESTAAVSETSRETAEQADRGSQAVQKVLQQMGSIDSSVSNSASLVKQLGKRSEEIGQIISVITGIAEQTSLLALNAAIEAARAGEHGKGFAVVADEVRKLSEQSEASARQISQLIQEIQAETDRAVGSMNQGTQEVASGMVVVQEAGEVFGKIIQAVQQVAEQIEEVSAATEQMSASSEEVTASVQEMATVAKESANGTQNIASGSEQQLATIEEIATSANELNRIAQQLQNTISKFRV